MNARFEGEPAEGRHLAARVALGLLLVTWTAIRLPLLAFLMILEPVVRVVLSGLALLVTLCALFLVAVTPSGTFPFWGMLAAGLGCFGLLTLYYGLMRLLS
jgi:hypothetical protein